MSRCQGLVLFLLLHFVYSQLCVGQGVGAYCSLSPGDTCRVIDPHRAALYRVYVFVDNSTCLVCDYNLQRLCEDLDTVSSIIEKVVIVCGMDHSGACQTMKHLRCSDVLIIGDPHYMYKTVYKVKAFPVAIVLDRYGIVQQIVSVTDGPRLKEMKQNLLSTAANVPPASIRLQQIVKHIVHYQDGDNVYGGRNLFGAILAGGTWAIVNNLAPQLIIVDTNGLIVKQIAAPSHVDGKRLVYCHQVGIIDNEQIMLYLSDAWMTLVCATVQLDMSDTSKVTRITQIEIDQLVQNKTYYRWLLPIPGIGTVTETYFNEYRTLNGSDRLYSFF